MSLGPVAAPLKIHKSWSHFRSSSLAQLFPSHPRGTCMDLSRLGPVASRGLGSNGLSIDPGLAHLHALRSLALGPLRQLGGCLRAAGRWPSWAKKPEVEPRPGLRRPLGFPNRLPNKTYPPNRGMLSLIHAQRPPRSKANQLNGTTKR